MARAGRSPCRHVGELSVSFLRVPAARPETSVPLRVAGLLDPNRVVFECLILFAV